MYVILGERNVVIEISETLEYQSNGNPLIHNGTLAIAKQCVKEIVELDNIPDEVIPGKYFYENGEFAVDPDWTDPMLSMPATKEDVLDLMDALADLYIMMGV